MSPASPRVTCSPIAAALASLSTTAVTSKRRRRSFWTSYPLQPGMRAGPMSRPCGKSTGPGRAMPTASSRRPGAWAVLTVSKAAATLSKIAFGPAPMSTANSSAASRAPEGEQRPTRAWRPPSSATANTPPSWRSRRILGRRPPVETPTPSSRIVPSSSRRRTTLETVEGATWRVSTRSAREAALPLASRLRACSRRLAGSDMPLLPDEHHGCSSSSTKTIIGRCRRRGLYLEISVPNKADFSH